MPSVKDIVAKAILFYKKASIESDMAKRIMISIIPALPGSGAYGGFDPIALKSAVSGAKDLIHFGAEACVDELSYMPEHDINYDFAVKMIQNAKHARDTGDYHKVLEICKEGFLMKGWSRAYGGKAWARIADTLLQISNKRNELGEPEVRKDPERQFEIMKEMVVLMNVFDGLAHNTGNVMPKVLEREMLSVDRNRPAGAQKTYETDPEYSSRVLRMMDAKELNNPLEVYKEIEHIISQTPYRLMFKDWLEKIHQHPDYRKHESKEDISNKIALIKDRKELMRYVEKMKDSLERAEQAYKELMAIKIPVTEMGMDSIINQHPRFEQKKELVGTFATMMSKIQYSLDPIEERAVNVQGYRNKIEHANLDIAGGISAAGNQIRDIANRLAHAHSYWQYSDSFYSGRIAKDLSDNILTEDLHKMRELVSKIVSIAHVL